MLNKVSFENIIKSKTAAGVEVILLPDASYLINIVLLKKIKSSISIEKQQEGISSFEELSLFIDAKQPIILVLNGKGIIHRKVTVSENETTLTLLNKVLPNANPNDFDLQQTVISPTQALISVVRSSIIAEVMEALKTNKLANIASCSLGPFVINNLLPLIDTGIISNEYLSFSNYQLQIREQQITDLTISGDPVNEAIEVAGDPVAPAILIAFAAAFSFYTVADEGIKQSEIINIIKEEYKQRQKFELLGWTLLIAVFATLLINYFVFDHYWSKNKMLSTTLAANQSAVNRYDTLKVQLAVKKEFLEQNGLLENSRTSFYADQLAAKLPASIQWTDVSIHPVKKKKAGEEIPEGFFFEKHVLKISGKCQKSIDLNDWMKEIKLNKWISNVTLLNYRQDNASDDGLFSIEIKLKD